MRDILREINGGETTIVEVYDIFDETVSLYHLDEFKKDIPVELGLDTYEWAAWGQGLSFEEMVKRGHSGCLKVCSSCNKEIDYKKAYWTIEYNKLTHLQC